MLSTQDTIASQTIAFREALAKTRLGLGDTKILIVGDSTAWGYGSELGLTYPTFGSWANRLNWGSSRVPVSLGLGVAPTEAADLRWNEGTGWALSAHGFVTDYQASAASGPLVFNPGAESCGAFDTFDIYYLDGFAGSFTATGSGGTATTVTTTNGHNGTFKKTVSCGAPNANNYLTIVDTSGYAFIVAVEAYNSKLPSIRIANAGQPGSTTANWNQSGNFSPIEAITAYTPHLTVIDLGINDAGGSVAAATFSTNVQGLITAGLASGSVILKSMVPSGTTPNSTYEALYVPVLYTLAASNNVPLIDVYGELGGVYKADLMYDLLHPNETLYAMEGELIGGFFRDNFGVN